jgi:hypothetical protein
MVAEMVDEVVSFLTRKAFLTHEALVERDVVINDCPLVDMRYVFHEKVAVGEGETAACRTAENFLPEMVEPVVVFEEDFVLKAGTTEVTKRDFRLKTKRQKPGMNQLLA